MNEQPKPDWTDDFQYPYDPPIERDGGLVVATMIIIGIMTFVFGFVLGAWIY